AQAMADNNPSLATWTDVGNSWEKNNGLGGYDMMVLKLTNSAVTGDKPKLFLTCAIHAREYTTAGLCLTFAQQLVDDYGVDADTTWVLDHHEVHLMLHANPDGRKQAETGLSWRKNTNQNYCGSTSNNRGADLNRNFDYNWGCCGGSSGSECDATYRGPYAGSEPEVQAVMNYMTSIFPDQRDPGPTAAAPDDATGLYLDIHSYSELVLWPWGYTGDSAPNGTQMQTLGRKFAYWNGYSPEQAMSLYATDGTTDDWSYGELGIASYCFELGTAFFQNCTTYTNTILPGNLPALMYAAKVPRTPYMTPAGPDAYSLAVSADNVPSGTAVTLTGAIDDTRFNNSNGTEGTQNIAAAEYYVDTPPWVTSPTPVAISMSASDGSFNSKTEGATASVDTTGWSDGRHILFVRGQDVNGDWGAFSAVFL
ncbi:MAG: carboxypeptidase, partial [bacterium]|nr:carboxypeptidase [bacterium]